MEVKLTDLLGTYIQVHGGALRNPLQALVQVCASLHDESGKVTVDGFYDDVIEPQQWEREVNKLPIKEEEYQKFLGVPKLSPPLATKHWRQLDSAPL